MSIPGFSVNFSPRLREINGIVSGNKALLCYVKSGMFWTNDTPHTIFSGCKLQMGDVNKLNNYIYLKAMTEHFQSMFFKLN